MTKLKTSVVPASGNIVGNTVNKGEWNDSPPPRPFAGGKTSAATRKSKSNVFSIQDGKSEGIMRAEPKPWQKRGSRAEKKKLDQITTEYFGHCVVDGEVVDATNVNHPNNSNNPKNILERERLAAGKKEKEELARKEAAEKKKRIADGKEGKHDIVAQPVDCFGHPIGSGYGGNAQHDDIHA